MIGKLDEYMRFNETALSLRSQRQELLASNIANADTPNYKARDIDFAAALQGAMAGSKPGGAMNTTNSNHMARGTATGDTLANGTPRYSTGVPLASVSPVARPRAMCCVLVVFIAPPGLPPAIAPCKAAAKLMSRAL